MDAFYSYPPLSDGGWWVQRSSYPRWICCTWECLVRKSPHGLIKTVNRVFQGNYTRQGGLSGALWVQTRTILEEWQTESRCPWTYRRFRVWSPVSHRFFESDEEAGYHHMPILLSVVEKNAGLKICWSWTCNFSICPGRHMALSCLYLSIATVLSVFKLEKAVDENGHVITPSRDYISSMILCVVITFDRSRVSTDKSQHVQTPRGFQVQHQT